MTAIYYDPKTKTICFPVAEAIQNVYIEMLQEFAELDNEEK
uniref:Uncharacterized protein n=1 Tax=Siphoviridae sp. ctTnV63 TaxID=2825523 RepID=A0A8S5NX79_9CAUD|nr:MAG TPA: hypothetical protein [Siphoviridae sp. ctTnV63]